MKILIIGDFHGKVPKNLKNVIKKEDIDFVISVGDFFPFSYRKVWFKHCYETEQPLWEFIGKKKYKKLIDKDMKSGESVLKKLNSLGVPVYTTVGNLDYINYIDIYDRPKQKEWDYPHKDFTKRMIAKYKNIKRVDYHSRRVGDLVLIGTFGHSFPGRVKSRAFKKYRVKLEKDFVKYKKENDEGRVILVSHNVPYDTKIDKISDGPQKGKHYGSKLTRRIINKFQPAVCVAGHIHEAFGKCKISNTIAINSGTAQENQYVILEFDEKKSKFGKVRLIGK